ncbi:MAG: hypothetical protein K2P81_14605 [Bacteriovoracaceae bacterium]|nr:hypothetical protein [Bacteriovoracaceae bacterium]
MRSAFFSFLILTLFNFAYAQHDGHTLTKAKIAHDASHRVGRLVDTGKLEDVFLKNMTSIEVQDIPHNQHTDPAFKVTVNAGDSQTVLIFDMMGKFLSNNLVNQLPSTDSPFDLSSNELLEAALHFAMEGTSSTVDLASISKNLVVATLKQQKNEEGFLQPVVFLTTSDSKTLQIVLSQNGDVISYSLVQ